MFYLATSFNKNLSGSNTSRASSMEGMFGYARSFNGDVGTWDTRNVVNFSNMFYGAIVFNQNLSGWNTSSATNMKNMFAFASVFNGAVGNWDTSNVDSFSGMFQRAFEFNQDLSKWDTSSAQEMIGMFQNAKFFNHDISAWNVRKVCDIDNMFFEATSFNQDLNNWREQLTTSNLCSDQLSFINVFTSTSCPLAGGPLPNGPFCQYNKFDADGLALKSAVRCYVLSENCNSGNLPVAARGSDSANLKKYYGPSIESWSTGRVETFADVFEGMTVSTVIETSWVDGSVTLERNNYRPDNIIVSHHRLMDFNLLSRPSMRTFLAGMYPKRNPSTACSVPPLRSTRTSPAGLLRAPPAWSSCLVRPQLSTVRSETGIQVE